MGTLCYHTYPDVFVIVDQLSSDVSAVLSAFHVVRYRALPVSMWTVGVGGGWGSMSEAGVRHYPGPLFYNEVMEQTNSIE